MGVYKRGRIWWIDFHDQAGNRVQESCHTTSKRDAAKLLALRQADVARHQFHAPCTITLDEFATKYVEYAMANKRSWDRDVQMLNHFKAFFGKCTLPEISALRVEEYKSYRITVVKKATVNRELTLLKRLFNLARVWDLFHNNNPVCKVKFFREDNIKLRVLTEDEESRLVTNA